MKTKIILYSYKNGQNNKKNLYIGEVLILSL